MDQRYLIGVDGGTESLRAGVFDAQGLLLGSCASPYETQFPHPSWAEQRPQDWWTALGAAVQGAIKAAKVAPQSIAALCVDTTCCTVVALDAAGQALRPALLWMDMRSAAQAAEVAACGDEALQVNGGGAGPVSAEWMVPKALWLKQHEPDTWQQAHWVCEYQDYINYHLTGRMCASVNNMSVRWHYNTTRGLPTSLLAKLGLSDLAAKWPQDILQLGETVGGLTAEAAAHLGLPEGTHVAQGGADAFIGIIGLGVCRPGQMALLTGSSHLHLGFVDHEIHGQGFFGTYSDAVLPGCHVIEGGQTSTGSVIAWFKRTLCPPGCAYDALNEEAAAVPPGCEGVTALDHFQGNRTPHTDALSRGALAGLTLKHGRGHIFRALMESVAFGSALILETMAAAGYQPDSITIAGGATRSDLWLQIHADAANLPLVLTKQPEAPMLGCAILAAVAAGIYADAATAIQHMVHVDRVVQPQPEMHELYRPAYERYKSLYPALRPMFHHEHVKQGSAQSVSSQPVAEGNTASQHTSVHLKADSEGNLAASAPSVLTPQISEQPAGSLAQPAVDPPESSIQTNGTEHLSSGSSNQPASSPDHPPIVLSPSILAADFANLASEVQAAVAAGAEWIHVDMFDGSYCANFTIGPPVLASLRRHTEAYLDCHVAVQEPRKYLQDIAAAGASGFTFHIEVMPSPNEAIELARQVRALGMRAGVSMAPDTALDTILPVIEAGAVDLVLCMTVTPGWGGQPFQPHVLDKVRKLRAAFPQLDIQVDGGVNLETAAAAVAAGANILVVGTAVFSQTAGGPAVTVPKIKQAAKSARG